MATIARSQSETVEHLFTQAILLPQQARAAFVEQAASETIRKHVLEMLRDFERLSGFLERPFEITTANPLLAPDLVLADRFRVIECIGRGGMGEVYAAEELLLGERVAIKLILSDLAKDPWLVARFRDEIRLSRRVSHRNICRVHDVYEHTFPSGRKILFFSMELLQGPTLADILARSGPLPEGKALPVLDQLAAGLSAAHAVGIVHRDFKPANVIMTSDGRAVITDFGLAHIEAKAEVPVLSNSEAIAGSLPYMAPEQLTGGHVTASGDVFSFGIVMYELVTGRRPFPCDSIAEALAARLDRRWERSPKWQAEIASCLEPRPDKRPKSVAAVLDKIRQRRVSRRRWFVGIAASVLTAYGAYRRFITPATPAGIAALLIPSVSHLDSIAPAVLDQLLKSQLMQSAHFELVSGDQIRATLARMGHDNAKLASQRSLAREVALREGARLLIGAELTAGPSAVLNIDIERLGSHPYLPLAVSTRQFSVGPEHQLMNAVTEAAHWIRRTVGESAEDLANRERRPEELTTASWDALLEYSQAEEARSAGRDEEAVRHLRRALELDPGFPVANMRLADILLGQGHTEEGYRFWQRAADLVRQRHLTDRESYRIRGQFLHDIDDNAGAEPVLQDWAIDFPHDYLPLFYLANAQSRLGRPLEALDSANAAAARAPRNPHVVLLRAQLFMEQGDMGKARKELDSIVEANEWWWQYEAEYRFLTLDFKAVWRRFQRMADMQQPWPGRSYALRACLWCECGQPQRAIEVLNESLKVDLGRAQLRSSTRDRTLLLGAVALRAGDGQRAIELARQVAALNEPAPALRAGALLAQAGKPDEAAKILASNLHVADYPVYRALRLELQAYIALARGKCREATELFQAKQASSWEQEPSRGLAQTLACAGRRGEASAIWAQLAEHPARYWLEPDRHWPGLYRDALVAVGDERSRGKLHVLDTAPAKFV